MRFHVLACDYDGTLALHGRVDAPTVVALERVRAAGRSLILVTGRQLSELLTIFPEAALFERIVAENGALLYRPDNGDEKVLAAGPPTEFIETLRQRGVDPAIGHVVVATWRPSETIVFQTIRDLGLDWQVILNKDAVMALPSGINKGTGLASALRELDYSAHEVVAVGDAENDHALFSSSACGIAVANAVLALKDRADWVTPADHGDGVRQLIDALLANELPFLADRLRRHDVHLGHDADGAAATLPAVGAKVLVTGSDRRAVDAIVATLIHDLERRQLQFCAIDFRGVYQRVKNVVALHASSDAALGLEVIKALAGPDKNVVIDVHECSVATARSMLTEILQRLTALRLRKGRPHWLILDDAASFLADGQVMDHLVDSGCGLVVVTTQPVPDTGHVLRQLTTRIIAATDVPRWIEQIGRSGGESVPHGDFAPGRDDALLWRASGQTATGIRLAIKGS